MSNENRTDTMALKLAAYARRAGVRSDQLVHAYQLSVEHRLTALRDVFHPDLLHPARTALILLEDAAVRDADVVTASALVESEFAPLRVPPSIIARDFSARVAQLVRSTPDPLEAGDGLAERLIEAPCEVALIALAERLDHARHLHFRDPASWPSFYAQVGDVYLPFAQRVSEPLAQRFSRWSHAFGRRFLRSA